MSSNATRGFCPLHFKCIGCDGNLSVNIFNKTVRLSQIRKALKITNNNKGEGKLALYTKGVQA